MKAGAKVRAARLVTRIERAIERGRFTPHSHYLWAHPKIGPCGCAVAAGQFLAGKKPKTGVLDGPSAFDGVSYEEAKALEGGYEGHETGYVIRHPAFADAGRELSKFHPDRTVPR